MCESAYNMPRRHRGGVEVSHYSFLTSAVDGEGGQRHASATLPLGRASVLGTLCSGIWVVLLAGVDEYGEEE